LAFGGLVLRGFSPRIKFKKKDHNFPDHCRRFWKLHVEVADPHRTMFTEMEGGKKLQLPSCFCKEKKTPTSENYPVAI